MGIPLHLLAFPEMVGRRNLAFYIDNIAVMYGWQNGFVKNVRIATKILKAAQYLEVFLCTTFQVAHVPRMSHPQAKMADELSRKEGDLCGRTNRPLRDVTQK